MGPVLVRQALPTDLDALLALYQELGEGKPTAAPGGPDESRPVLEQLLADRGRHLVVAIADERIIGTADLLVVPNLTHHGKPWAIIENVVVAAAFRRERVGAALVESLIDTARMAGCYKVQLLSGKHRRDAHAFYRRLGLDAVAEGFRLYLEE
jgi:GNAT superfamily N-acetyltransferase